MLTWVKYITYFMSILTCMQSNDHSRQQLGSSFTCD